MNWLVFDIETVPDVELGRRVLGLAGLERCGRWPRPCTPCAASRAGANSCRSSSTGRGDLLRAAQPRATEGLEPRRCATRAKAELIARFFDGIEKYTPDLVSWNGSGFDLPVLHYRALKAGVQAPRYWETGEEDTQFPLQQLPEPLPLAAPGPDGRAVGLPGPRARLARRHGRCCSDSRASSASRAIRSGTPCSPGSWPRCAIIARPMCSTPISCCCASSCSAVAWMRPHTARNSSACARCCAPRAEPHHQQFLEAWEPAGLRPSRPGASPRPAASMH